MSAEEEILYLYETHGEAFKMLVDNLYIYFCPTERSDSAIYPVATSGVESVLSIKQADNSIITVTFQQQVG